MPSDDTGTEVPRQDQREPPCKNLRFCPTRKPETDLTRIIHQPEKSIKASTFDVRVAPSPAASQAHHEPTLSP